MTGGDPERPPVEQRRREATLVVDARSARCPLPVIELARAVRGLRPGDTVLLLATDPAAAPDVAAWCRMRGQRLMGSRDRDGVLELLVEVA
ncbi:sulfurtransferase TusA family protein [Thalassiella azotivora]